MNRMITSFQLYEAKKLSLNRFLFSKSFLILYCNFFQVLVEEIQFECQMLATYGKLCSCYIFLFVYHFFYFLDKRTIKQLYIDSTLISIISHVRRLQKLNVFISDQFEHVVIFGGFQVKDFGSWLLLQTYSQMGRNVFIDQLIFCGRRFIHQGSCQTGQVISKSKINEFIQIWTKISIKYKIAGLFMRSNRKQEIRIHNKMARVGSPLRPNILEGEVL